MQITFIDHIGDGELTTDQRMSINRYIELIWFADTKTIDEIKNGTTEKVEYGILACSASRISTISDSDIQFLKSKFEALFYLNYSKIELVQNLNFKDFTRYLNLLNTVDCILSVNNKVDYSYILRITGRMPCRLHTFIETELLESVKLVHREGVIIGGKFNSVYKGFESYIIASELVEDGNYIHQKYFENDLINSTDETFGNLKQLPKLTGIDWYNELNKYKYAVHMSSDDIFGEFNLACAGLGIPCIGINQIDSQVLTYPTLSVRNNGVGYGINKAKALKSDSVLYKAVSTRGFGSYRNRYTTKQIKNYWNLILNITDSKINGLWQRVSTK